MQSFAYCLEIHQTVILNYEKKMVSIFHVFKNRNCLLGAR